MGQEWNGVRGHTYIHTHVHTHTHTHIDELGK